MNSKNIAFKTTNKELSANTGLFFISKIFDDLNLSKRLNRILPKKKRERGPKQIEKFKALLLSFAAGSDSLSDLDELSYDKLFTLLTDGGFASRTAGDFLRSFNTRKIQLLQDLLIDMALHLRKSMYDDEKFILTMDSTPHEHHAKKMQGLSWNYKNYWCLDSQNAYDQYGFSYLFDLRPGNTHTSVGSELWVRKVFSRLPDSMKKYFRADSGYSKNTVYTALEAADAKFTIALKSNIGSYVRKKHTLEWTKTDLKFFESDKCEVAMGAYPIKSIGNFRVVFIRAPKKDLQGDLFKDFEIEDLYDYYSIITNISSFEKSDVEIIEFYRGRANAENFIKEQKYGYDFLHFPCQKLDANRVYGLIGTFSYNMMRYLSFCMTQKIKRVRGKDGKIKTVTQMGYYAKKIRNNLIKLPCQVVCHARKVTLKISTRTEEVFTKIMEKINLSCLPATNRACSLTTEYRKTNLGTSTG